MSFFETLNLRKSQPPPPPPPPPENKWTFRLTKQDSGISLSNNDSGAIPIKGAKKKTADLGGSTSSPSSSPLLDKYATFKAKIRHQKSMPTFSATKTTSTTKPTKPAAAAPTAAAVNQPVKTNIVKAAKTGLVTTTSTMSNTNNNNADTKKLHEKFKSTIVGFKGSISKNAPLPPPPPINETLKSPYGLFLSELMTTLFFPDPTVLDPVGTNHDLHVDPVQRKRVVKALQKANASEVNEVITILKAMPDPTLVEFKKDHVRDRSTVKKPSPLATADGGDLEDDWKKIPRKKSRESNDQTTGVPDPESIPAPSSWWAVSLGSLLTSFSSTDSTDPTTATSPASPATKTTNERASVFTASAASKPPKHTPTTGETLAQGTTALLIALAEAKAKETKAAAAASKEKEALIAGAKGKSKMVFSSKTATLDKATVVSTINSISKQALALYLPPPTHMISAYTYWWGYEIYVPHKCMSKLEKVTNTSLIFFGFLSGTIASLPGLAVLSPLARIISAWVGFQWAVIKAEDLGKGVVLSATWVLPVALAPRPWDHPGTEDAPRVDDKKQKKIKA